MQNNLHDIIVDELIEKKSLAALIYLIDSGRELEFTIKGKRYFISCSNSNKYVSLWYKENEQSFDSVYQLIENSIIENKDFISLWEEVEIDELF